MMKAKKFFIFLLISVGFYFGVFSLSFSAGTIDSVYKYAWSNNIGWVNFNPQNGNVQISDSGVITGHIWNENYGWINMAPANGGVTIDNEGNLSGYAWGESLGWINFSGVKIDCAGEFLGTATGDQIGILTFDCTNCSVVTNYRPPACSGGSGGDICGDKICRGLETCQNCPQDCGPCLPVCGDKKCESPENCENCPIDCGTCAPSCGNKKCEDKENCLNCPQDCGVCPIICGDKKCEGNETCQNCPQDCGPCLPVCGDKKCESPENCENCPIDCGECKTIPKCGDGFCKDDENCHNCPQDCGPCKPYPFCGDGICNNEETCKTCPQDCGECKIFPPFCGNKKCEDKENCLNCPQDCGECINPKIIQKTTQTISTIGIALTTIAFTFAPPLSLTDLLLLPQRLLGILLIAFGWKKRNPPWGTVYDSVTKQPLDPAYVILKDQTGKEISSAITDLDGRYGFLAEPGVYLMTANKTNYLFPSKKLAGKTKDELYDNLYFGEPFEIKRDEIVRKNIPLDPLTFDWNEFVKQKRKLTKFFTRWDLAIRKISDFIYYVGFIFSIIAYWQAPYPYNTLILSLYLLLLLLRALGIKPKPFGFVLEKYTGNPLPFAILRIIETSTNKEISHKITDKYGRYFCLVPKGKYYVKIEKKNEDGSYSLIYTSSIIDATKTGIIKKVFRVSASFKNPLLPENQNSPLPPNIPENPSKSF